MQGDAAHTSATLPHCYAPLYLQTPAFSLWEVLRPSANSDPSSKCIQSQGLLFIQSFPYKLPVKCRVLYFLKAIMFSPVCWLLFVPGKFLAELLSRKLAGVDCRGSAS